MIKNQIKKKVKNRKMKQKSVYDFLLKFANRKVTNRPMGANEDDKVIYGID